MSLLPLQMKPLFIPMKRQYFEAFCEGSKTVEYRKYGPRWNKDTCLIGRRVTLSLGYGKQNRRSGIVRSFYRVRGNGISDSFREIYGPDADDMASIGIDLTCVWTTDMLRTRVWKSGCDDIKRWNTCKADMFYFCPFCGRRLDFANEMTA